MNPIFKLRNLLFSTFILVQTAFVVIKICEYDIKGATG